MDARKIAYLNAALFTLIVFLAAFVVTADREVPAVPDLAWLENAQGPAANPTGGVAETRYPNFGRKRVFDTLIPLPTPTPTPVPTPEPDPDLEQAVGQWSCTGVLRSMALFEDASTKEEFQIKVGETREASNRGKRMIVTLESTDMRSFSAVLTYRGPSGVVQRITKSALDD